MAEFKATISLQEKRTGAKVTIALTDSDANRLRQLTLNGEVYYPVALVAYACLKRGMREEEERRFLAGTLNQKGGKRGAKNSS